MKICIHNYYVVTFKFISISLRTGFLFIFDVANKTKFWYFYARTLPTYPKTGSTSLQICVRYFSCSHKEVNNTECRETQKDKTALYTYCVSLSRNLCLEILNTFEKIVIHKLSRKWQLWSLPLTFMKDMSRVILKVYRRCQDILFNIHMQSENESIWAIKHLYFHPMLVLIYEYFLRIIINQWT